MGETCNQSGIFFKSHSLSTSSVRSLFPFYGKTNEISSPIIKEVLTNSSLLWLDRPDIGSIEMSVADDANESAGEALRDLSLSGIFKWVISLIWR